MSDGNLRETERKFRAEPTSDGAMELLVGAARAGALSNVSPRVLLEAMIEAAPDFAQNDYHYCRLESGGNILNCYRKKVPRWCGQKNTGSLGICLNCCGRHGCSGKNEVIE